MYKLNESVWYDGKNWKPGQTCLFEKLSNKQLKKLVDSGVIEKEKDSAIKTADRSAIKTADRSAIKTADRSGIKTADRSSKKSAAPAVSKTESRLRGKKK